jgi:hypothetical protein
MGKMNEKGVNGESEKNEECVCVCNPTNNPKMGLYIYWEIKNHMVFPKKLM